MKITSNSFFMTLVDNKIETQIMIISCDGVACSKLAIYPCQCVSSSQSLKGSKRDYPNSI